jgi:hypothetical protein
MLTGYMQQTIPSIRCMIAAPCCCIHGFTNCAGREAAVFTAAASRKVCTHLILMRLSLLLLLPLLLNLAPCRSPVSSSWGSSGTATSYSFCGLGSEPRPARSSLLSRAWRARSARALPAKARLSASLRPSSSRRGVAPGVAPGPRAAPREGVPVGAAGREGYV